MSKFTAALFATLICILHASAIAQAQNSGVTTSETSIDKDTLDYYLLQAVNADQPQLRRKLNHIGLITIQDDQGFIVSSVLDGYPAQLSDLRPGDRINTVDGSAFHPIWSFNSEAESASGFLPNPVAHAINIDRNGNQQTVSVVPVFENLYDSYRSATINSVQEFSSGNKIIGYLKLWSVSRSTNDLITFKSLIDSLSHCDGLIVDMRDGYGFIAAQHLDQFFPSRNSYFTIENATADLWNPVAANRQNDDYFGKAMVVIQNSGTRAGMELFSYQLAKLQRIVSLGENTAGQLGSVFASNQSNDLRYLGSSDTLIDDANFEGRGIEPEQVVGFSLEASRATDPQLEAAVSTLMAIM